MDGMLSQEEINALLNETGGSGDAEQPLTDSEKDAIGEVANISMGTAATTLFSLVNRKVDISTPVVTTATWDDLVAAYERPCVFIRIGYTVGLDGSNVLVLKEHDVKVITSLMMGGDGQPTDDYKKSLAELKKLPWGKKAVKIAISIGQDADDDVLVEFTGNKELVLQANNASALTKMIKWASTAASLVSAPASIATDGEWIPADGGANPVIVDMGGRLPDLDDIQEGDVW